MISKRTKKTAFKVTTTRINELKSLYLHSFCLVCYLHKILEWVRITQVNGLTFLTPILNAEGVIVNVERWKPNKKRFFKNVFSFFQP